MGGPPGRTGFRKWEMRKIDEPADFGRQSSNLYVLSIRSKIVPRYEREFSVAGNHRDCRIFVRMSKARGAVSRFAVQLQQYSEVWGKWGTIAQFDHDPNSVSGHDVFAEGLHVDLYLQYASDMKIYPDHPPLRDFTVGGIIRACIDYFREHDSWFVKVCRGTNSPTEPPDWRGP